MHSIYIQFNNTFKPTPNIRTGSFLLGFPKKFCMSFFLMIFYIGRISWVTVILDELELRNFLME